MTEIRLARFTDLDTTTLHDIIKLRIDVFVVEQACPYPELDGRDTEPETRHLWAERDGKVLGYLRILAEPDGAARIGRVCTAAHARGDGIASRLLDHALAEIGDRPIRLDAQSYLVGFYQRYGFRVTGAEFVEDGIPHVPMARDAASNGAAAEPR